MLSKFPNITQLGSRNIQVQIQAAWFQNPCSKYDTGHYPAPNILRSTWHVDMEQLLNSVNGHAWAKVAYVLWKEES